MDLYAIGGLGADQRVFQHIDLPFIFLDWIDPKPRESIEDYAKRFSLKVNTNKEFILIGVSFGGMLAVEMNKHINPSKTIIISSASTRSEIPKWVRNIGEVGLHRLIPLWFLKPPKFFMHWIFSVKLPINKLLLKQIINDTKPVFIKWAVDQIINWRNELVPQNLIRIHGSSDRLLKTKSGINYKQVKGGGHFMIVEQAQMVAKLIKEEI